MPLISAAGLDFNKLTPRLKDRPIAATTSVLPKAGKPYALRFYRSSSSTAACSMRCGAVQYIAALTHSGRSPIHGPACLPAYPHAMPTCTSVSHLTTPRPVSHRKHTMPAGPALTRVSAAIVALRLRPQTHARQTDLHGMGIHVGTVRSAGGRPGIASHARLWLCL